MRTARRIKQNMFYSLPTGGEVIYERDSSGNIIYDTMPDGESVARVVGETDETYSQPVEFKNSITGNLTEEEMLAFGDKPGMKAKMTFKKGEFPFVVGTKIWLNSQIEYQEGMLYPSDNLFPGNNILPDGKPNTDKADFIIVGIQDTGRHFYKALLAEDV